MAINPLKNLANALTGAPDVPTAEEKAKAARQAVIDAQAAVEQARAALVAADDAGDAGEIQRCEAALISSQRSADRSTRGLEVAEQKLLAAQESAKASAKIEGAKTLRQATDRHSKGATAAQKAIDSLTAALTEIDAADATIAELQRQGVGSANAVHGLTFGPGVTRRRIELALFQAKVLTGAAPYDMESIAGWSDKLGRLLQSGE
jgi:hypothetical protein